MKRVNLEKVLQKERARHPDSEVSGLEAFKEILRNDDATDEKIVTNIFSGGSQAERLTLADLETENIYTGLQIKKICTRYRLRFLDAQHFSGEIPHEAIAKVKKLQKDREQPITNFKMVAPASMYRLQYKDKDPLLFIPLGNDRYYLVHKWGKDLHPLRKLMVFPFRNLKTLVFSVALLAFLVVYFFPDAAFIGSEESNTVLRVIFFFYLFIAFSGLTALYGFSRLKNFNSALWDSKYMD